MAKCLFYFPTWLNLFLSVYNKPCNYVILKSTTVLFGYISVSVTIIFTHCLNSSAGLQADFVNESIPYFTINASMKYFNSYLYLENLPVYLYYNIII